MLEHYLRAAKELGLDLDKIYTECVKSAIQDGQLREAKKKMRKELK